MLILKVTEDYFIEKKYIAYVFFNEILGVNCSVEVDSKIKGYKLILPNGASINAPDLFFDKFNLSTLSPISLIPNSIDFLDCQLLGEDVKLPVLFGGTQVESGAETITLDYDFLGSAFFTITCMEEYLNDQRDKHGRFLGEFSIANKFKYLEQPIVDQAAEYIWQLCLSLDYALLKPSKTGSTYVTCDVDWPYDPRLNDFNSALKYIGYALIRKKSLKSAFGCLSRFILSKLGGGKDNNRKMVSWIMDVNEKAGNKVLFYFIPIKTSPFDSNDSLEKSEKISELLQEINTRGHSIGIHPGYECVSSIPVFEKSINTFQSRLLAEGIKHEPFHNRTHFLKWDIETTASFLEKNNINYDSTLGFADKVGFRCGTAHEFTMFDIKRRVVLKIKQRPLLFMEGSLLNEQYENVVERDLAFEKVKLIKDRALLYGGNFTMLWHNTYLESEYDKLLYLKVIK
ncbi:polysaccharide deacetylase family protein [Pseudoalteromonas sp. Ld20]|uniref:polysaccharide deacetylase family protein n=1 Tax=Pseudoalteromonas sp. Ld20 TaxID=649165 RepID=UPI00386841E0